MKYDITGTTLQFLNCEIEPGETMVSNAGSMVTMSGNISMKAMMRGGFFKAFKRSMQKASFMLVEYKSEGGPGTFSVAGHVPGKIYDINVGDTGPWICQKSAFLCSEETVNLDMTIQRKLRSAMFGGNGLILQELKGTGYAFIHACGEFHEVDLSPGQTIKISTSHAVAWQESVQYDINSLGIKNGLFSGEGLFVTTLVGPGKVIVQSMTVPELQAALGVPQAAAAGIAAGAAAGGQAGGSF